MGGLHLDVCVCLRDDVLRICVTGGMCEEEEDERGEKIVKKIKIKNHPKEENGVYLHTQCILILITLRGSDVVTGHLSAGRV